MVMAGVLGRQGARSPSSNASKAYPIASDRSVRVAEVGAMEVSEARRARRMLAKRLSAHSRPRLPCSTEKAIAGNGTHKTRIFSSAEHGGSAHFPDHASASGKLPLGRATGPVKGLEIQKNGSPDPRVAVGADDEEADAVPQPA